MIGKLLGHSRETLHPLAYYLTAVCHGRMLQRMNYRTFEAFFSHLKDLQNFQFSNPTYMSTPKETNSDRLFLSVLKEMEFGKELLDQIHSCHLEADDFYTQQTYMAFHQLLCRLLREFKDALIKLDLLQSSETATTPACIMAQLAPIAKRGTLLRLMLRGAALKKHLRVVESLLPNTAPLTQPGDEGEEAEFLESHSTTGKSKTYIDLLQLILVYFDATPVLVNFVRSKLTVDSSINIKVLFQSPLGRNETMLTWMDLLQHQQCFPAMPTSAKELIEFLTPDLDPSKLVAESRSVMENLALLDTITDKANDYSRAIDKIIDQVQTMTTCTSARLDYIDSIHYKLESSKNIWKLNPAPELATQVAAIVAEKVAEISKMIRDFATLSEMLRNGTALSTGIGFKGACHAEGLLVSFCTFEAAEWAQSGVRHSSKFS